MGDIYITFTIINISKVLAQKTEYMMYNITHECTYLLYKEFNREREREKMTTKKVKLKKKKSKLFSLTAKR